MAALSGKDPLHFGIRGHECIFTFPGHASQPTHSFTPDKQL